MADQDYIPMTVEIVGYAGREDTAFFECSKSAKSSRLYTPARCQIWGEDGKPLATQKAWLDAPAHMLIMGQRYLCDMLVYEQPGLSPSYSAYSLIPGGGTAKDQLKSLKNKKPGQHPADASQAPSSSAPGPRRAAPPQDDQAAPTSSQAENPRAAAPPQRRAAPPRTEQTGIKPTSSSIGILKAAVELAHLQARACALDKAPDEQEPQMDEARAGIYSTVFGSVFIAATSSHKSALADGARRELAEQVAFRLAGAAEQRGETRREQGPDVEELPGDAEIDGLAEDPDIPF